MKLKCIIMQPLAVVELTTEEVNLLEHWASQHYDATCQRMAVSGGLIHGLKHRQVRARATLNFHEVDLLVKCLDRATEGTRVVINALSGLESLQRKTARFSHNVKDYESRRRALQIAIQELCKSLYIR